MQNTDNFFTKEVHKRRLTWRFKVIILLVLILMIVLLRNPILYSLGSFLVYDTGDITRADIVILEEDVNSKEGLGYCLNLYTKGLCKEIWAVKIVDTSMIYTDEQYLQFINSVIDSGGYKVKIKYFIFDVEHPVTLNKSLQIQDSMKTHNYTSAILVTNAFHSKRSYKVYNKIFQPNGISIQSKVYYTKVRLEDWYKNSNGLRYVFPEYIKYIYYTFRGFI
ncbi:MAG: hypothetical protein WCK13_03935 [Ignavibacteriota bacterium]